MLLIYHLVTAGASILSPFRVDPGVAYRSDDRTIHACGRSLRNGGRSRRRPAAFTGGGPLRLAVFQRGRSPACRCRRYGVTVKAALLAVAVQVPEPTAARQET